MNISVSHGKHKDHYPRHFENGKTLQEIHPPGGEHQEYGQGNRDSHTQHQETCALEALSGNCNGLRKGIRAQMNRRVKGNEGKDAFPGSYQVEDGRKGYQTSEKRDKYPYPFYEGPKGQAGQEGKEQAE